MPPEDPQPPSQRLHPTLVSAGGNSRRAVAETWCCLISGNSHLTGLSQKTTLWQNDLSASFAKEQKRRRGTSESLAVNLLQACKIGLHAKWGFLFSQGGSQSGREPLAGCGSTWRCVREGRSLLSLEYIQDLIYGRRRRPMRSDVWPHEPRKFHFWVRNCRENHQDAAGTGHLGQKCVSIAPREVAVMAVMSSSS